MSKNRLFILNYQENSKYVKMKQMEEPFKLKKKS